ncbi:MAG: ABC transporter permease [Defluviitaleaceae bacterium]|nr:ABC transporter permease [Defluviitaleaceae bacterium]
MSTLYFLVQQSFFFIIPLLIVALGGMFSEKSGIVNIALEGKMLMGAFVGILFINRVQFGHVSFMEGVDGNMLLFIALFVAAATGMFAALFHAYASISLNANQIISGVALNMFAPAFAMYVARILGGTQQVPFNNTFRIESVPVLGDIPVIGQLFFQNTYFTTFLGFVILAITVFVIYKTRFGLRLRACGEHPQAADSVGVNVYKVRYASVLISGALAGMGGLIFIIPTMATFTATVSGYGFLALAVVIFGAWRPQRILFAAIFFGLMQVVASAHSGIGFLVALEIPSRFYSMIPYIATLVVLGITSNQATKNAAPKAIGKPYDKGVR